MLAGPDSGRSMKHLYKRERTEKGLKFLGEAAGRVRGRDQAHFQSQNN